jgi:hypothetical protein
MISYNGFSGAQRMAAQKWLNEQWAAGTLKRPSQCVACGQTAGPIDAHAEDYSQPFAAGKTDQYHLCYVCHLMVHCRFRNPERFKEYCRRIAAGERFIPDGRNWKFIEHFLSTGTWAPGVTVCAPPERDVLKAFVEAVPQI